MKTTKAHFELFKKESRYWIKRFGLLDWRIDFEHNQDKDQVGNRATCATVLNDRIATLTLSLEWNDTPTTRTIKKTAFHEVCELLLARIHCLANTRCLQDDEIGEATHAIIRRLENAFFEVTK